MSRRKTNEEFIRECILRFPNKDYDYSKVEYKSNKTNVIIICPHHGEFSVIPQTFLESKGCSKCSKRNKLTTDEIITKANYVHNNRYTYDLTDFTNSNSKIKIICSTHGEFFQKLNNHIHLKHKCPKCPKYETNPITKRKQSTKRLTKDIILKRFEELYRGLYTYDTFNTYTNNKQSIYPNCKEHGVFEVSIDKHLSGRGCPKCGGNYSYTTDEIIDKLKICEPSYDYSKVKYKNYHSPVTIVCRKHGLFKCSPANFINGGNRCPNCSISRLEQQVRTILTKYNIQFEQEYSFDNLTSNRKLRFDFFLKDYNTVIECQGIQHFEFVPFFHRTKNKFKEQVHRDNLKKEFCKENNINLILFSNLTDKGNDIITTENELIKLLNEEKQKH